MFSIAFVSSSSSFTWSDSRFSLMWFSDTALGRTGVSRLMPQARATCTQNRKRQSEFRQKWINILQAFQATKFYWFIFRIRLFSYSNLITLIRLLFLWSTITWLTSRARCVLRTQSWFWPVAFLSWLAYAPEKVGIPARTPKWPPRLIFAGACHGQSAGTVTKTCDEHVSM